MSEQKANLYGTVVSSTPITTLVASIKLAAPYVAGSGSIQVTSTTGAPGSGTFSLTIFNVETGAVYLIFRVTSVAGTTFTGAAEGPDSNAPMGAAVAGTMITSAALTQIEADTQAATIAAINAGGELVNAALPNTAVTPGSYTNTNLTVNSKGVITAAANGSGGGGGGSFIQPLTAPVAAGFTPTNFNTGSGVTTSQFNNTTPVVSITLQQDDPNITQEIAGLIKPIIAPTFTVTIGYALCGGGIPGCDSQSIAGLWLVDVGGSFNLIWGIQATQNGFRCALFSDFSTFNSDIMSPFYPAPWPLTGLLFLRIQETASNRIYSLSVDGINFLVMRTESVTAHITTAQYGWALEDRQCYAPISMTIYSFAESNP